jgi:hypothetical protein
VAQRFLCPELWTQQQYAEAIHVAGMRLDHTEDITRNIVHTWEVSADRARAAKAVFSLLPAAAREFVEGIELILQAYRGGDLTYTVITASK